MIAGHDYSWIGSHLVNEEEVWWNAFKNSYQAEDWRKVTRKAGQWNTWLYDDYSKRIWDEW